MKTKIKYTLTTLLSLTASLLMLVKFDVLPSLQFNDFWGNNVRGEVLGTEELSLAASEEATAGIIAAETANPRLPVNKDISLPIKLVDSLAPELMAKHSAVIDGKSGVILYYNQADEQVPIASITKLVTALVWLEYNPGWENIYKLKREDRREGGRIYLFTGEQVKIKDLFYLSLVGSANTATMALVHSAGFSEEEFVIKMNKKVKDMGLAQTTFYDPLGLDAQNISTAKEVSRLVQLALADENIKAASLTDQYQFTTNAGQKKVVYSTDLLLDIFPANGIKILGGKTGFIQAAGYCFSGLFAKDDHEIVIVILNSQDQYSRFTDAQNLAEWVYKNYRWR